jgi:hypothetical protein
MISFAAAVARLDAEADSRLGDFLFYDVGGIISSEPVNGFITDPAELQIEGLDASLDNVGKRRRLKISRVLVTTPTKNDRIRGDHPLLDGATWKPSNWRPITNGRYWIMDLEKLR